jgi:ParB family chromosome partitioning protein
MTKKALGRGLDALINGGVIRTAVIEPAHVDPASGGADPARTGVEVAVRPLGSHPDGHAHTDEPAAANSNAVRHVGIDTIDRSRLQPRTEFDPEQLQELANSIKQRGVVQPLLVRPIRTAATPLGAGLAGTVAPPSATGTVAPLDRDGRVRYELIAGERRWRAAREAGLTMVPVIVREASDQEALEVALIENLQREDLNPIEEARAYEQLTMQFKLTQEQIADKVGRSRAAVANAMRLLALPSEVQSWIADNRLSVGHAKAILGLSIAEEQRLVAERVLKRNLTVRETEKLVEQLKGEAKVRKRAMGSTIKSAHILAIEERLQQKLGTHVAVYHGKKKGRVEIEYYGNDDLTRLLALLGVENL